jgi:hypothetical protein
VKGFTQVSELLRRAVDLDDVAVGIEEKQRASALGASAPVGLRPPSVGGRVEIHRVRELGSLGHVVAQESFLPATVVRRLHPSPVAFEEAVALRHLIGRSNDDECKLNFVVVGHSRFSGFKSSAGRTPTSSVRWEHIGQAGRYVTGERLKSLKILAFLSFLSGKIILCSNHQ